MDDQGSSLVEPEPRRSERKRRSKIKISFASKKGRGGKVVDSDLIEDEYDVNSIGSKCIICYSAFNHSNAFSKRNKLSPTFCKSVLSVFSRFLDLQEQSGLTIDDWDFESFPLPFCQTCSGSVLGWTKLQEQCEELQATLAGLRNSVRDKIVKSTLRIDRDAKRSVKLEENVENEACIIYDKNIDVMRQEIFNDIKNSNPGDMNINLLSDDVSNNPTSRVKMEDEDITIDFDFTGGDSDGSDIFNSDKTFTSQDESEIPEEIKKKDTKKVYKKKKSTPKDVSTSKTGRQRHPQVFVVEDGRKFYGDVELIEVIDEDGVTKFKCGNCGSVQKTLLIFKRHVQHRHLRKVPFECGLCGKVLRNVGSKSRHMKIFHSENPRQLLTCEICGKGVTSQRGMVIHKGLIHGEGLDKFHLCDICSRPFHNEREMKTHRWTHQSEEERRIAISTATDAKSIPQQHVCSFCGKILSSEASLKSHVRIHSCEKPFICHICAWPFRHKVNLLKHLEIHMDEEETMKFICEEPNCGKKYRSKTQLRNHAFSHKSASAKPHKCEYCDAFFVRALDLTVHKRTHTGEKPYQCQVCEKYFSRQHHWTRHMRNVHHVLNPGRPTKNQPETTIVAYIEDFNNSLTVPVNVETAKFENE